MNDLPTVNKFNIIFRKTFGENQWVVPRLAIVFHTFLTTPQSRAFDLKCASSGVDRTDAMIRITETDVSAENLLHYNSAVGIGHEISVFQGVPEWVPGRLDLLFQYSVAFWKWFMKVLCYFHANRKFNYNCSVCQNFYIYVDIDYICLFKVNTKLNHDIISCIILDF